MFQACRPAGRLFYLVLAVVVVAASVRGSAREEASAEKPGKAASSPTAKPAAAEPLPRAASPTPQSGPALTSVIDTVYMADGSNAQGVLVITWPAFTAANGAAVAAGATNVTLGTNGALNVALAPNAGATPANTYYVVVYQLQPSEVRTEYWVVPTSSPATLAEVRTTPGSGTAAQPVSMQYVNSALAAKANDSAVVHLAGTETVTGTKSFAVPPNVPTPVGTGDVTNKAYVDASIATVGSGNYLPTAGGAMTGPLTLSGNPTAPLQAAAKQYVDLSAAAKADLVTGLVPSSELGSGTASGLNCLLGNGTWGSCGSSANATEIQSVPVGSSAPTNGQVLTYSSTSGQYAPATPSGAAGGVVTGPGASQNIAQPVGTELSVNNLSGIRYVTPTDNWSVSPSGSLIGGTQATVTLTPCPVGVDTSGNSMYFVYLSGQGTPEPAMVTGGTCTSGASSGTIVFTPKNTHSATYVLSSASSGIQEAINDACGVPSGSGGNPNARVILPATGATTNALPVHGSIFAHCSRALIEGNGTLLSCSTRDRCVVLGDLVNSNHYGGVTLRGVNLTSTVTVDGCQITNTQRQSNVVTITVASGCSTIQTGDLVNINFTDNTAYWGSHGPVTVSGTSITYSQTAGSLAAVASPGTIAIQNAAIEDNALPGTMEDIKYTTAGGGKFNQFFVVDNDQAATIRNFDNGAQGLLCTANHCGSFVYSAGTTAATPVLWLDKLNISAQCGGNGVTVYANNSTHINDSVIQGFGMWGIYTSTVLGSYGGTQIDNVYNEEGSGPCPNPYMGNTFGSAGIIYFSGGSPLVVRGGEQPNGWMPEFASTGSTQYNYYVVVRDTTEGVSYPLYAGYALSNGSGNITVQWPHVAPVGSVTYDLVRMVAGTISPSSTMFPVQGACGGGSPTACGSVATNLAQCSGLVCSYTDLASANTSSYAIATPGYFPSLAFWPGGLVLNGNGLQSAGALPTAFLDTDEGSVNSSAWISTAGFLRPTIYARQCSGGVSGYGGAWIQCLEGDSHGNSFPGVGALLLNSGPNTGSQASNLKGRLNFEISPGVSINPQHIVTLVDSNPAKTLAAALFRPLNDASDTYIGLDNGNVLRNQAQLTFGAPVAISSYIGNAGDNASYLERLTASGKTFNVPVNINGNLTVTGSCTGCGSGGGGGSAGGANSQLQYNNGGTFGGSADYTYSGHVIAGGASAVLDMSAAPAVSGLKIPLAAGAAPTADGQVAFDTTAHNPVAGENGVSVPLGARINNTVWVDGGTGKGHYSSLCAGLAYAAANHISTVWDSIPENGASAWTKDPFNDATCGNGYFGYTLHRSAGTWMTQVPVVEPGGVIVIDSGRGSENQVNPSNMVEGTLTIACQAGGSYTGGFAMSCPSATNFPGGFIATISRNSGGVVTVVTTSPHNYTSAMAAVAVPIVIAGVTGGTTLFNGNYTLVSVPNSTTLTFAETGASESGTVSGASTVGSPVWSLAQGKTSFSTRLSNTTISAAGIPGSLCAQNIWSQERTVLDAVTCDGAQVYGVDWEGPWTQNSRLEDVEVMGGSQTTTTMGVPTTFSCYKISVNGPAGSYRDLHCNPRGTATTTPINVAMYVTGTQGGHIDTFHYENSNFGVVVDGAGSPTRGLKIDGLNTAAASADGSTPTAMVKICGVGSTSPCTSGIASSNISVGPLAAIAPNLTTNCVVDDTANGGTGLAIAYGSCPAEYESGALQANTLTASSGTFSGNVTVNGQLLVAGPWTVSSPIPGAAMAAAGAGTSALGISSDGNFYISANAGSPQKVATATTSSYFSNLFQEDANDLGEYNGTTPQNLHVYSSYTNSSTWLRTSLGYDGTDNYAVVRSESSPSGSAPGLGFWVNSGLKWVVDASSNFKPWTDQIYSVGSFNSSGSGSGLRPGTVYVAGNSTSGSGFELGRFASESYELCNDTTNGTIVNGLAVLTTAGCAAKPSSALVSGAIGVVIANAGTSGVVTLARTGSAYCSFDGSATVVGDYVVPSSTASSSFYPLCHDAGATPPTGTQVLGRVLQASSGSTTVQMFLEMPGSGVSSSASYSIPWFTTNTTGTAISFSGTANKAELWGVVLTFPLTTTQVTYDVSTADNTSNTYDIGVLNSSGNVVAHIGNTAGTAFAASTGWKTLSWAASATLQPGKYYLAITSSCTSSCAQVYGGSSAGFTFVGGSSGTPESVTAGGTLNNGITIPADNPTEATIMAWEIH